MKSHHSPKNPEKYGEFSSKFLLKGHIIHKRISSRVSGKIQFFTLFDWSIWVLCQLLTFAKQKFCYSNIE